MVFNNITKQLHKKSAHKKEASLTNFFDEKGLLTLQAQLGNALTQWVKAGNVLTQSVAMTEHIQELATENEVLTSEIIELRRQLITQLALNPTK